MTSQEFDWTDILPPAERAKALADRQAFFDSFPSKAELELAAREGRAIFANACAKVDFRKALHKLLADAVDDLGVDAVKAQLREAAAMVDTIPK